jgi:hypothetical protein
MFTKFAFPIGIGVAAIAYVEFRARILQRNFDELEGILQGLMDGLYQERVDHMFNFLTEDLDEG